MGNPDQEMSEDNEEKLAECRQQAMEAFSNQDYEKSASLFTEAIKLNPQSALLFAKRAYCYIHLNKPNACIRDCNRAIELNPDSAPAHKYRGRAHRFVFLYQNCNLNYHILPLLGSWATGKKQLRTFAWHVKSTTTIKPMIG